MAVPRAVKSDSQREEVELLVVANLPLVGHLVRDISSKVPGHVSRDELSSAGMMALVVSAQNFDPERGVPFVRFAAIRVRGAIMDELRGMDWAVRAVRTRAREVDNVRTQLFALLSRTPRTTEIAAAMGIPAAELYALDADVARAGVMSLEALTPAGSNLGGGALTDAADGPESQLLRREQLDYLYQAINELPPRLRTVVTGYFFEERKMAEIAAELHVTESRISQMRAEAIRLLRGHIGNAFDDQFADEVTGPIDREPPQPVQARAGAA